MRPRRFIPVTRPLDSDEDLRDTLNIQSSPYDNGYEEEQRDNLLYEFSILIFKVERKRVFDAFFAIKRASQLYERNTKYRYSNKLDMENRNNRLQQFGKLKLRSRSSDIQELERIAYDKLTKIYALNLKLERSSKESEEPTTEGRNIIQKITNLEKLLKTMKKETHLSKKESVVYIPQGSGYYPRHHSQRYFCNRSMPKLPNYTGFQPRPPSLLTDRSIYRPVELSQRFNPCQRNPQRFQRVHTQQTVSSGNRVSDSIASQIKQISKQMKQLILLNLQAIQLNTVSQQTQIPQNKIFSKQKREYDRSKNVQSAQERQKQTQPTQRSHQQTINFQVEDFSKKDDASDSNYQIQTLNQHNLKYRRYNSGRHFN